MIFSGVIRLLLVFPMRIVPFVIDEIDRLLIQCIARSMRIDELRGPPYLRASDCCLQCGLPPPRYEDPVPVVQVQLVRH